MALSSETVPPPRLAAVLCISVCDGAGRERGELRWARMQARWRRVGEEILASGAPALLLPPLTRFRATTPEEGMTSEGRAERGPSPAGAGPRSGKEAGMASEGRAERGPKEAGWSSCPAEGYRNDPEPAGRGEGGSLGIAPASEAPAFAPYLSPLQRACAWSHRRAWEAAKAAAASREAVLVLEDDVVFRRGWAGAVASFLINPPGAWDMLLLNAAEATEPVGEWVPARDQCLAGAYILTQRGAAQLLELTRETVWAADWSTQLLQARGRSWTRFPWLAIQEGSDSHLQPGNVPAADAAKVRRLLAAHGGEASIREDYLWEA